MEVTETALIVPMPAAEQAVSPFRASLDPAASWGVPAHVTVLYPFLPPARIDDDVIAVLDRLFRAVPRFDVTLTHVEWFGDTVVWLAPRPDHPFRDLTNAVWDRYPEAPPYGGAYAEVVPHLTIGQDAPKAELSRAADTISARLPIEVAIETVRLIAGTAEPGSWRTLREFALGDVA
jgi:2'-5' RNA ligase